MSNNEELYSPVYGCVITTCKKEMKTQQMKTIHKHIIELAEELYQFSDSLGMNNKEELGIQKSIFEALQNLNHVIEYLTKYTLSGE